MFQDFLVKENKFPGLTCLYKKAIVVSSSLFVFLLTKSGPVTGYKKVSFLFLNWYLMRDEIDPIILLLMYPIRISYYSLEVFWQTKENTQGKPSD